jgi:hypothetical protein
VIALYVLVCCECVVRVGVKVNTDRRDNHINVIPNTNNVFTTHRHE